MPKKDMSAEEIERPGQQIPAPSRKKAARRPRRWLAVLGGSGTLLLATALVGAASVFPGEGAAGRIELTPHPLPLGTTLANCQGPTQLLAGSAVGADPEFSANSSRTSSKLSAVVLSNPAGDLPAADLEALDGKFTSLGTISAAEAGSGSQEVTGKPKQRAKVMAGKDVSAESVVAAAPFESQAAQAAGSVVVVSEDGDLQGMAAASCQYPSNELWLSGASTTVGRTAVLMVTNSAQSAANVSLELISEKGPVQAAGGKGIVVPAGSVRSVVLAGLAPDAEALTVHLKSTGAAVSAVIQQSVLRGLTPGGVDFVAPVQAPGSSLAIPGVRVQDPKAAAKIANQGGYADAATALSVTVPGLDNAVVEVQAFGADGQVALPNGGVFTATAGTVSLFELKDLPAGDYTLTLNSDVPVTASVRLANSQKPGEAIDFAYAPASARLSSDHLVALPSGTESSLVLTAPEGAATVQLQAVLANGSLGQIRDVELKTGMSISLDPASLGKGAAAVLLSASGSNVYGSQVLSQKDSANISVLPIQGTHGGNGAITIRTGY